MTLDVLIKCALCFVTLGLNTASALSTSKPDFFVGGDALFGKEYGAMKDKNLPSLKKVQGHVQKLQEERARNNGSQTFHGWLWEDLDAPAKEALSEIQSNLMAHLGTYPDRNIRPLTSMDEIYFSAVKHQEGSDKVFITPHLDGFFFWVPFMSVKRCIYGAVVSSSGKTEVATVRPFHPVQSQQNMVVREGDVVCFDYNNDLHWIVETPKEVEQQSCSWLTGCSSGSGEDMRVVLKYHFVEFPKAFSTFAAIGESLNSGYNQWARKQFVASLVPSTSLFSTLLGHVINLVTRISYVELYCGVFNAIRVLAVALVAGFSPSRLLPTICLSHYVMYILVFLFRSVPLEVFIRDAMFLKAVASSVLILCYLRHRLNFLSILVAGVGFSLSAAAYRALGPERSYFGHQYGRELPQATEWPYGTHSGMTIPHPMIVGGVIGLLGLCLNSSFRRVAGRSIIGQCLLYGAVLTLEVTDLHVPDALSYNTLYDEFRSYHLNATNIWGHMFSTSLGVIGAFGLVHRFAVKLGWHANDALAGVVFVCVMFTQVAVYYHDPDVAVATALLLIFLGVLAVVLRLSTKESVAAIVGGFAFQELAHWITQEPVYMWSYLDFSAFSAAKVVLHTVFLNAFNIKALFLTPAAHILDTHSLSSIVLLTAIATTALVGMRRMMCRQEWVLDKSWVLTCISAHVTSAIGIYYVLRIYFDGFSTVFSVETTLSRFATVFFLVFLIWDGVLMRGPKVPQKNSTHLFGQFHHVYYIFLCSIFIAMGCTQFFASCLHQEIPIIALSMAKIQKQSERSLVWLSSYMFFRVALHGLFLVKALQFNAYLIIPGCVQMVLNLFWFRRWWYKFSTATSESPMVLVMRSVLAVIIGGTLLPMASIVMLPGYSAIQAASIIFMCASVFIYICHTVTHLDSTNFIVDVLEKKNIIYNITWEDPSVEIKQCGMKPGEVVLTISSAGDNIMDYLIEKPEAVVAADMNVAQLALLDLKLAAASVMEQEEFFNLFGVSDAATFHRWYPTKLRPLLQLESSKSFWDERQDIFENNLMFAGESGNLAYVIHLLARAFGVQTAMLRVISGQKQPEDAPWSRTRRFFKWFTFKFGPRIVKMCCGFAGVPASQWDLMEQNIGDYVERMWEIGDQRVWMKGNYFFTGYVMGCFLADSCPRYMSVKHFAAVKAQVKRVKLFFGTWAEAAQTRDDFSFISLLDSMDWMTNEQIASSLSDVVKHTRSDARLFWRSAYGQYSVHAPVLSHFDVVPLPCGSPSDPAYDRVGFYLSQWSASVRKGTDLARHASLLSHRRMHAQQYANSVWGDLQVCYQMVLHAMRPKKDSVQFYKEQGPLYDGFREKLLPLRSELFRALPTSTPIKRWLSVGCGTARDLEFIFEDVKHWGTEVVLLDLSPELLVMAKERVNRLGMQSQVSLIEGNFLEMQHNKLTPGSFDLISCSYCLTMIPQWSAAVEKMIELLEKDGSLGITDFTVTNDSNAKQAFYKWWFANDGVFMNRGHVDALRNHANMKTVYYKEEANRVPYTPLFPTSYVFHGRRT